MKKLYISIVFLFFQSVHFIGASEIIEDFESLHNWRVKPEGMTLQSEIVKEGGFAAEFSLFHGNIASRTGVHEDWSQYDALVLWMYNEEPNAGVFGISLTTLHDDDSSWNYFLYMVKADWQGWKQFVISKEQFRKIRNPDWSKIHVLKFSLEWDGSSISSPEHHVVIDDVRIMTQEEVDLLPVE